MLNYVIGIPVIAAVLYVLYLKLSGTEKTITIAGRKINIGASK